MTTELQEQSRRADSYRRNIRAATRALWLGAMDFDQFFAAMETAIRMGIPQAWHEGARECGVQPSELTSEERLAMQRAVLDELNYVTDFGLVIEAGSKANGGKLTPLMNRAALWVNRYKDITNRAKTMACGDQKLMWVLGKTKEHCASCLKLNGKVKRASQWDRAGIRPQHPDLECGGWRCECSFEPTDEPMSKGPLPRIP
jgi:hypothetical protein